MEGQVIHATLKLYRSHLKSYFLISLRANIWLFLPLLILIPAGIIIWSNINLGQNSPWFWLIAALVGVILFIYGLGKYWVNAAVISRLAFCELINQPETVKLARMRVARHLWAFVFANFFLSLFFIAVYLLCLFGTVLYVLISTNDSISETILPFWVIIAISSSIEPSLQIFGLISAWLSIRLLIFEIPLVIERNRHSLSTITRSWTLTKGKTWDIFSILLTMAVIIFPLEFLVWKTLEYSWEQNFTLFVFLFVTLPFLVKIITLPLWQAMKGAVYYNLHSVSELREG